MQGRFQGEARSRFGLWALIVPIAVFGPSIGSAQDDPDRYRAARREPVTLAADRVATWDEGGDQWVRLSGRAGAFQGARGIRFAEGVVRIRPGSSGTQSHYRLELYAEGDVRSPADRQGRPIASWVIEDAPKVTLKPFEAQNVIARPGPPTRDPLRGRALEAFNPERPPTPDRAPRVADLPPPPPPPPPPTRTAGLEAPTAVASSPMPAASSDARIEPVSLFDFDDEVALDEPQGPAPADRPGVPSLEVPPPPPGPGAASPFVPPSETQFFRDNPGAPGLPEPIMPGIPPFPDDPLIDEIDEPDGAVVPEIVPLPDDDAAAPPPMDDYDPNDGSVIPVDPNSRRVVNLYPLNPDLIQFRRVGRSSDGTETYVIKGGINIVIDDPKLGTVDITADSAVIWTGGGAGSQIGLGQSQQSGSAPLELYLEGDVEVRRDERKLAGPEDQVHYIAKRFFANINEERFVALEAELEQYAPGLLSPLRTLSDRIVQSREFERTPEGQLVPGRSIIHAERATSTGSPFANPGYRIRSRTVDLFELGPEDRRGPLRRRLLNPAGKSGEDVYLIDARSNAFFLGPLPFFYWPRFLSTTEDLNPPLEQISFRTNNLFGQMILTDFDGFKLLGLTKPKNVDDWNLDIDYLSDRGFALGSEFGYFGDDFSSEVLGRDLLPGTTSNYFGYLDFWGIKDSGFDNLGSGPAIITDGPPFVATDRSKVPPYQDFRGRFLFRHMQSLLPDDADPLDDFRFQLEAAYVSDRHFLEQYYRRLFDNGLDQQTRAYGIRQWRNQAVTVMAEANLQNFYTDTQWYPKIDYYHLGSAPFGLGRFFSYFQRTGVDYANTHTAAEVNNPNLAPGFLPYDPTSLTSGAFRTGRLYTNHEIDLPLQFNALRVVPYVQGQLVGWDNQYNQNLPSIGFDPRLVSGDYIRGPQGSTVGRAWGAYGARADIAFQKLYRDAESELLNIHGLMHKVDLYGDYRDAYSTLSVNRIGIQDDLDDNTYEFVRRYFALNDFGQGVLPAQYSPVLLTLRRTMSPISGTVDVQDRIETLKVGLNQRLQTKRGPIDDRRVIDWMTLDVWSFYYPDASRDNFGVPFGQTQYQYEWFIGDRTSIVSSGWFDYFDINGDPRNRSPLSNGISVITAGVNISRPPRGSIYLAYSIIDSGPINTSALNTSFGYWMSPRWYGTFGGLYDFGEGVLLSTSFSLTRIGADFLTTVGLSYTPLQENYSFVFELVPRFSPRTKLGSASGIPFRPDLRFAPIQ